jgi:hypothetical protein
MKSETILFVKCLMIVFFISSISTLGCEDGEGTNSEEAEYAGVLLVRTLEELPNCSPGKNAVVYYVQSTDEFYYCDGNDHILLDLADSCTVAATEFGTVSISCEDGTSAIVGPVLISIQDEEPGDNCEFGGKLIQVGVDGDDDGMLDPEEVTSAAYDCVGSNCDPSDDCCESNGTWKTDEVQQPETDLVWLRCPVGQTWEDGADCGCVGTPQEMHWCDAAGMHVPDVWNGGNYCTSSHSGADHCAFIYPDTDYRLPTLEELQALLDDSPCIGSSVCAVMFGEDIYRYWSWNTVFMEYAAYTASFPDGDILSRDMLSNEYVRCVR